MVEANIMSDNVLLHEDGSLDTAAMVELIAQSFAVIRGYYDMLHNKPAKFGFLVGVDKIQFGKKAYRGDCLRIRAREARTFDNFSIVEGEVMRSDEILAFGTIKVWISEEMRRDAHSAE